MKICSVDVGSNAIRLFVVEYPLKTNLKMRSKVSSNFKADISSKSPFQQWTVLKKERYSLRLGADVFKFKYIRPDTEEKLISIFQKIAALTLKFKTQKTIIVATSAFRDAQNQKEILDKVSKTSGLKIQVISGDLEAELIKNAIDHTMIFNQQKHLLLDIGGGSAELTEIHHKKFQNSKSYPLGVVRLKTQLEENPKLNLKKYFKKILKNYSSDLNYKLLIGTGGNFEALIRLQTKCLNLPLTGYIEIQNLKKLIRIWKKLTPQEKTKLDFKPDRQDVLIFALELIEYICQCYKIELIKVPMTGLKEGILLNHQKLSLS